MNNDSSPRVIYDITGTVELLSPLHVGSGHDREIATVKGREGDNTAPGVAAIVRDGDGAPYIPGTTIKGLLRRIGESHGSDDDARRRLECLFGVIKKDGAGTPGRVTVFGMRRSGSVPAIPDAPFVAGAEADLGRGMFVAARTRIDTGTGTAGDHTLFHQEMVAPKTCFQLRLRIDARAGVDISGLSERQLDDHGNHADRATRRHRDARADADRILEQLLSVLHPLCAEDGQSIGKGQADGFGRLRLSPKSVEIRGRALGPNGDLRPHTPGPKWTAQPAASTVKTIHLVCDGPFLVIDASKKPKAGENPDGDRPHISPQSWNDRLPMLLGSSLSGALRARARWLAMRKALRAGKAEQEIRAIDPHPCRWKREDGIETLTDVQRLFGVTGFRGRLAIARLHVREATPWDVTSVKLDRFTGGPVDNALFKTRAFLGVSLDVAFAIEDRPVKLLAPERKMDQTLFDELLEDIRTNGLVLGHGGNKGFGWFRHKDTHQ